MGGKIIIKSMNQSIPSESVRRSEAAVGTVLTGYRYRIFSRMGGSRVIRPGVGLLVI